MAIQLDHLIVPVRDKVGSAKRLAEILGVPWSESGAGPFAPVYVSNHLTLDFDEAEGPCPTLHYAFQVSDAEFDAIFSRIQAAGIPYQSSPHGPPDMRVGAHAGGRLVYWREPSGHVWEILTASYARQVRVD